MENQRDPDDQRRERGAMGTGERIMGMVALKMLFGDLGKFLGLVFGVAFATLLINQQAGIFVGLLERTSSIIQDASEADLWVMDPGVRTLDTIYPLRDTELPRIRGISGVRWAAPLFKSGATVRTSSGILEGCVILGVDDASLIGVPSKVVMGRTEDLRHPESIAVDAAGYRRIWPGEPMVLGKILELNDRRAVVTAIVDASPSFSSGPMVYTRYTQALRYTNNGRNQLSFILARSEPGQDPQNVARTIHERSGLKALTYEEFRAANRNFVLQNTGIPISVGMVIGLGVLVGVAVVGLILNLFILENLKQFAALKAIGVRNMRLARMVLLQAFTAGIIGWSLGVGAAAWFFDTAKSIPNFQGFFLPWYVVAATAVIAAGIITASSFVGLRRVLFVDPAVVFRS